MALSYGIFQRQIVQVCEHNAVRCACGYYAKGEYHYTLDDAQKAGKRMAAHRIISTRKKADRMVADLESIVKHGAKVTT